LCLIAPVYVNPIVLGELRRIIEQSDILKSVSCACLNQVWNASHGLHCTAQGGRQPMACAQQSRPPRVGSRLWHGTHLLRGTMGDTDSELNVGQSWFAH